MSNLPSRREFIRTSLCLAGGAVAGSLLPEALASFRNARANDQSKGRASSPEERLKALRIELPPVAKPIAVYVPAVQVGPMLYTSGHVPRDADGNLVAGKVGAEMSLEQGNQAARLVGLHILSTVRGSIGSLDNVVRLVKVLGMVNCTPDFTQQPQVVNGFSELMVEIFGEDAGKAARSAVGVAALPGNVPVEIEAIFEVRG